MPTGWRITKSARVGNAFDGEGARLHGGRWNSPGTAVVYTAESQSLAALELLVHLHASQLLASYSTISADFPDELVQTVDPGSLPEDWQSSPAPLALQELGDRWAADGTSVVLRVPSVVVPLESNFILNPRHPDFGEVVIGSGRPFQFDPRLK